MAFTLKNAVIHNIEKDQHATVIKNKEKKNTVLDVKKQAVVALVKSLVGVIGKSSNSVIHGTFRQDGQAGKFPPAFDSALLVDVDDSNVFLELTHIALDEIADRAKDEPFATGGYLLFAVYDLDGEKFFISAMIKHKDGIRLNKNLEPEEVEQLDLSKIYHAVRINIDKYQEVRDADPDTDEADFCYVGFIGKSEDGQASVYFVEAFGCVRGLSSSKATSRVFSVVEKYFESNSDLAKYSSKAQEKLLEYLVTQKESGGVATLAGIKAAVVSCLPTELVDSLEPFEEYLNGEEGNIPSEFPVSKREVDKRLKIRYSAENKRWSLQFDKNMLGDDEDSTFYYNRDKGYLTLTELPPELIAEIERVLQLNRDFNDSQELVANDDQEAVEIA